MNGFPPGSAAFRKVPVAGDDNVRPAREKHAKRPLRGLQLRLVLCGKAPEGHRPQAGGQAFAEKDGKGEPEPD